MIKTDDLKEYDKKRYREASKNGKVRGIVQIELYLLFQPFGKTFFVKAAEAYQCYGYRKD